jgi:hypothetical protein
MTMSDTKSKALETLERLCDSSDEEIALTAARELNSNEQRALDRQPLGASRPL